MEINCNKKNSRVVVLVEIGTCLKVNRNKLSIKKVDQNKDFNRIINEVNKVPNCWREKKFKKKCMK